MDKTPFKPMTEDEKIASFHKWMVCKNPKINTCIKLMEFIEKYIDYKLQNVGMIDAVMDKMDAEFASLMEKNFEKKS